MPDEERVAVAAVLEGADVESGGRKTCGGGNPSPRPVENLSLPGDLERAANPVRVVRRAGAAFLAVRFDVLRAVVDSAAERCQL